MSLETNSTPTNTTKLLQQAQEALTLGQYSRMQTKAIEKIGIFKLMSMKRDDLKNALPKITAWDPEEADITSRLNRAFGFQVPVAPLLDHPVDYIKWKIDEWTTVISETLYDAVPDQLKAAKKANEWWASTATTITTAIAGENTWKQVQQIEKTLSFFDTFREDPLGTIKNVFDMFMANIRTLGFVKAIQSLFGSAGLDIDVTKGFVEKLWIPKSLAKSAAAFFSDEKIGKMNYGTLKIVWEKHQKNEKLDIIKELGLPGGDATKIVQYLAAIFWKKAPDIMGMFPSGTDISKISIWSIIQKFNQ